MKTKRISIVVLGAVLCTLLASCGAPGEAANSAPSAGGSSSVSASGSGENSTPSRQGLRWYTSIETGYAAEKGFYRVKSNIGGDRASTRISYIDYASKVEVPLCNLPQCDHNNERCAAMLFSDGFIQSRIFGMDGSLFLFSTKQQKNQTDAGVGGFVQMKNATALYQMNADGTGRTEILEIGEEYQLSGSLAAGNGLIFVAAVKTVADAVVAQPVVLQIDPARRTAEELQFGGVMCGVFNNSVVISKTGYGDLRGLSDAEAMAEIRKSKTTIVSYDPETGAVKEHASVPANNIVHSFIDGNRLIYTPGENALYFVNLENGETGTLTQKFPGRFMPFSQADGKIGCSFDDGAALNAQTSHCLTVSCENGSVAPFTLYTRQSVSRHPVEIIGDAGDRYLVRSDIVEKEEYVSWAGSNQISMVSEGYALIEKQAYWAGRADFEPITMLD